MLYATLVVRVFCGLLGMARELVCSVGCTASEVGGLRPQPGNRDGSVPQDVQGRAMKDKSKQR